MRNLISQIIAGVAGLWLAIMFVPGTNLKLFSYSNFFGFPLNAKWQIIILLGFTLGLLCFFSKPALRTIPFPIRIATLPLFSILINIVLIWLLDFVFQEITIPWVWPLLWTAVIIWALGVVISKLFIKKI